MEEKVGVERQNFKKGVEKNEQVTTWGEISCFQIVVIIGLPFHIDSENSKLI